MQLKRRSSSIQVKRLHSFQLSGAGVENGTNTLRDNLTRVPGGIFSSALSFEIL